MIAHVAATFPVLIWLYLLAARGGFWRVASQLDSAPLAPAPPDTTAQSDATVQSSTTARPAGAEPPAAPVRVVALIPARDEATTIGTAVASLLSQDFAGSLQVIVIDDGSTDGTAGAACAAGAESAADALTGASAPPGPGVQAEPRLAASAERRLAVLSATAPPAGWTGKLWALSQGVEAAAALSPDYLLFTDADIQHERGHVSGLIRRARVERCDLVSTMVMLSVDSFAERCLIPAFVFFFFKLYPPRWIASMRSRIAGAAGGCMLIRPQALQRIGGLAAVHSQIIDDCALAGAVKRSGGRVWLGLTRQARSLRRYGSFAQVGSMISRSAFNQLRHSYLLLAATLLGLACTYLWGPLLLLTADRLSMVLGASAWVLMSLCYLPMVRFYGLSPLWSPALPAIATFYAGATVHSALQYRLGRGGIWKGRVQDVRA